MAAHPTKQAKTIDKQVHTVIEVQTGGAPNFAIWAPTSETIEIPFICLEPWWGLPDEEDCNRELNEKLGIMKLEAGSEKKGTVQYSFLCFQRDLCYDESKNHNIRIS